MTCNLKQYSPLTRGNRLWLACALSVVSIAVNARQPKLVVGIVVDGLQQEYIDLLRDQFGPDGFNRLLNQGVVIDNVDYGTNLDAVAATAMVMTGAAPSVNGIGAATHFAPTAMQRRGVFDDPAVMGNYTDRAVSPKALRVTTLADESRIAGAGVTYAYAIAPTAEMALAMAGHAANNATWFDQRNGNWAGSTYYTDMPTAVNNRNRLRPLSARLDTMQWQPSANSKNTDWLPDHLTHYPFRYTFPSSNHDRYAAFASSPLINNEITSLAVDHINTLSLGTHDGPDMLNVAYTLKPYEFSKTPENRYELIDGYVKLDAYLAQLMRAAERQAGAGNALIYLVATPPQPQRRRDDERWQVPSGEFSTRKAVSLLNLYLIALHGNGDWVRAFADNTFYLNAALADQLGIEMPRLRTEVAEFIQRMSGVDRALTVDAIINATSTVDNPEALRRNTVASTAGDVRVWLAPGWELVDDYNAQGARSGQVTAYALTTAPAYILAPQSKSAVITDRVDARILAPTVAGQMHIRSPNGAALSPMRLDAKR